MPNQVSKRVRLTWAGGYVATANLLGLEEVASGKFERRRDAWEDLAWRLVGKLDAANLRLATDTKPDGEIRNENWSLKSLLQEAEAWAVTAKKESAALRNQVEALRDEVAQLKAQKVSEPAEGTIGVDESNVVWQRRGNFWYKVGSSSSYNWGYVIGAHPTFRIIHTPGE